MRLLSSDASDRWDTICGGFLYKCKEYVAIYCRRC